MLEFYKGDKAALQKMADQIANLTASEYIESTWNALQEVLPSVNDVLNNENAMQDEIDEVYTELVKAFVNLRLKPSKDLLQDLIKVDTSTLVKPGDKTVSVKTGDTTNMMYSLGGLAVASIIFYENKKRKV